MSARGEGRTTGAVEPLAEVDIREVYGRARELISAR